MLNPPSFLGLAPSPTQATPREPSDSAAFRQWLVRAQALALKGKTLLSQAKAQAEAEAEAEAQAQAEVQSQLFERAQTTPVLKPSFLQVPTRTGISDVAERGTVAAQRVTNAHQLHTAALLIESTLTRLQKSSRGLSARAPLSGALSATLDRLGGRIQSLEIAAGAIEAGVASEALFLAVHPFNPKPPAGVPPLAAKYLQASWQDLAQYFHTGTPVAGNTHQRRHAFSDGYVDIQACPPALTRSHRQSEPTAGQSLSHTLDARLQATAKAPPKPPFDAASQGYIATFYRSDGLIYGEPLHFTGWRQSAGPRIPLLTDAKPSDPAHWGDFADQLALYAWRPWHVNSAAPAERHHPIFIAGAADSLVQSMAAFKPSASAIIASANPISASTNSAALNFQAEGRPSYNHPSLI